VFPATVTTIQFADDSKSDAAMLKSRTKDGLEVELEASLQYLIDNERLYDLYMKFGRRYHSIFVRMATDILTTAATQYTANEFFTDRSSIGIDMTEMLEKSFQQRCFVTVPFFQLRTVILPKQFEESIQDTEVQKQDIQTATAQQQSLLVEYETKVIQAKRTVEVLDQEGQANAQAVKLANDAYCEQLNASVVVQAEAYHKMLKTTFRGDINALLRSMHIRAMRDHGSTGATIINDPADFGLK
jgi:regulator of protease activity HflC (stomatin/prohibitin superfamily)